MTTHTPLKINMQRTLWADLGTASAGSSGSKRFDRRALRVASRFCRGRVRRVLLLPGVPAGLGGDDHPLPPQVLHPTDLLASDLGPASAGFFELTRIYRRATRVDFAAPPSPQRWSLPPALTALSGPSDGRGKWYCSMDPSAGRWGRLSLRIAPRTRSNKSAPDSFAGRG